MRGKGSAEVWIWGPCGIETAHTVWPRARGTAQVPLEWGVLGGAEPGVVAAMCSASKS